MSLKSNNSRHEKMQRHTKSSSFGLFLMAIGVVVSK